MKIVIGSGNKDKVKIVEDALKSLHLNASVEGVEVGSKIGDQPLGKEAVRKGAINWAKSVRKLGPGADFWIGLESGFYECEEEYRLIAFACLIGKSNNQYIGRSKEIHIPNEVSKGVKNGERLEDVAREYSRDNRVDEGLITRAVLFKRAVQGAYVAYLKRTGNMKFRQRISAVVMDEDENFLIAQLTKYGKDDWNFPGGGIEGGEGSEEAVLRELREELGVDKFEVLKKSEYREVYDWPSWLIADDLSNKKQIYRGQEATFFLVKFLGQREDIKLDPNELRKVKWVKYEDIKNYFNFPRQVGLTDKIRDLLEE
jgi:non-canonical (house-cleaning) NTP pyrophosphatase/8-oxo-dGTP pyrophosphatase MutT (NUDIX family)